ncbi:Cilia- and flagella-associated protein 91, partial [Nowakowskiella sp. JEL0078]
MFSALGHYPPLKYEFRPQFLSTDLGHDRRVYYSDEKVRVSGMNRFKYFRRPLIPYAPALGGQVVYARKPVPQGQVIIERPASPFQKTVSVQTAYRESEAQTDPYSPEYIIRPDTAPPELLALATLTFGAGLPVGMAELEMIERARAKRAWEASLPKVVSQETFEKRLKMMEEMELLEWQEREEEICWMHEARLAILSKVIQQREQENEEANNERVEHIWQRKLQERDALVEKIEKKKIKAIRKISEKRSKIENKVVRRDIISDYSNYSSKVYAPKARDGMFIDKSSACLKLSLPELKIFNGLTELESTFKTSVLKANLSIPVKENLRSPSARREIHMQEQLEMMDQKLKERKMMEGPDDRPLKYSQKIEKPIPRPQTPKIEAPKVEDEEMEVAALQLQRLIRGRIAQYMMYQGLFDFKIFYPFFIVCLGKERRLTLISELRTRIRIQKAAESQGISNVQNVPAQTIATPEEEIMECVTNTVDEVPDGIVVDQSVPEISSNKEDKDEILLEGSEEWQDKDDLSPLIAAALAAAQSSGFGSVAHRNAVASLNAAHPPGTIAREFYEKLLLEQSFEINIQGEYVGKTLDYLSKELLRLREERRIAAMVKLAERTRRMREAEES